MQFLSFLFLFAVFFCGNIFLSDVNNNIHIPVKKLKRINPQKDISVNTSGCKKIASNNRIPRYIIEGSRLVKKMKKIFDAKCDIANLLFLVQTEVDAFEAVFNGNCSQKTNYDVVSIYCFTLFMYKVYDLGLSKDTINITRRFKLHFGPHSSWKPLGERKFTFINGKSPQMINDYIKDKKKDEFLLSDTHYDFILFTLQCAYSQMNQYSNSLNNFQTSNLIENRLYNSITSLFGAVLKSKTKKTAKNVLFSNIIKYFDTKGILIKEYIISEEKKIPKKNRNNFIPIENNPPQNSNTLGGLCQKIDYTEEDKTETEEEDKTEEEEEKEEEEWQNGLYKI